MNSQKTELQRAVQLHRAGKFREAEPIYREILRIDPNHTDALNLLGLVHHSLGKSDEAATCLQKAVELQSNSAVYLCNLGTIQNARGEREAAERNFRAAIERNPNYTAAYYNLANTLREKNQFQEAIENYRRAIERNCHSPDVYNNLGLTYDALGQHEQAQQAYQKAIEFNPRHPEAVPNFISSLIDSQRLDTARLICQQALSDHPGNVRLWNLAGTIALRSGETEQALARFQKARQIAPQDEETVLHLASVFQECGQYRKAAELLNDLLADNAKSVDALNLLGIIRREQGRIEESESCFRRALEMSPSSAETWCNLGNTLKQQRKDSEAIDAYERALQHRPNLAVVHANLSSMYESEGRVEKARHHLRAALAVRPSPSHILKDAILLPPVAASIKEMRQSRNQLQEKLDRLCQQGFVLDSARELVPPCFYAAYQGENDRPLQETIAKLCPSSFQKPDLESKLNTALQSDGRIRVGFISSFFREHTIGRLMEGWITHLSREAFHVSLLTPTLHDDDLGQRLRKAADSVVTLTQNLPVALNRAAAEQLDVLVYADVGMDPLTSTMARSRVADVQCVTWGHPVTTGMQTIDYFLSSELLEVENADSHYSERLIKWPTLPTFYRTPQFPDVTARREQFGLPTTGTFYFCPQSLFKFHPDFDEILAEILRSDANGFLVLIAGLHDHWTELLMNRLRTILGRDIERVHVLPRQSRERFLRLMSLADVMLDTLHFGGGNTNYEAFALGVPVVTLPSNFMRGRVTAALYAKMGITDGTARTAEEYVQRAVTLGTNREFRTHFREQIKASRAKLYDDFESLACFEQLLHGAVKERPLRNFG
ncbi:MAG: hypothetical protein Tsb009_05590 [Planctomycetaceae bacterium]